MGKIKLFTHGADLDGVGCSILAYLAFGRKDVDVEYCNYDDVDEKVEELLSNSDLRNLYDKIFITDISINEELAKAIDVWINPFNVYLFDHRLPEPNYSQCNNTRMNGSIIMIQSLLRI